MTKREKIIAIIFCISMILMIFSSIYTIQKLKPKNAKFLYERIFSR